MGSLSSHPLLDTLSKAGVPSVWHPLDYNVPVARRRTANCAKCGALKILLRSGASRCLACHNRWGRNYYRANPVRRLKQRESYVFRKYGVSMALLIELLQRQDGRCAICATRWEECRSAKRVHHEIVFLQSLYVDHDHRTKAVRGLLCNACNTAIGLLRERPGRLLQALFYLEGFKTESLAT